MSDHRVIRLQLRIMRPTGIVSSLVAVTIALVPGRAIAQDDPDTSVSVSQVPELPCMEDAPQLPSPPPLPTAVRRPKLAITVEQVETFANLMGETEDNVVRRLRRDPGLVSFVAAAADARRARERAGRNSMILGFTTVGLGATVGLVGSILSGPGYPGESPQPNEKSTQSHFTTDVIGVVLVGLGLITATYGIIMVAAQSDIETEAVGRYQGSPSAGPPISSPGISRALSVDPRGSTFSLSLSAITF